MRCDKPQKVPLHPRGAPYPSICWWDPQPCSRNALRRTGFRMEKRGKLRCETLCDRRCSGAALDDFAILNGLAIQRLVAAGGLSVSPGGRSIQADRESAGKQLRAVVLVQR